MTTIATLAVRLIGDIGEYRSAMSEAVQTSQKTANEIGKNIQKVGQNMTNLGQKATVGLTLPIIGAGVAALDAFSDLNESTNAVNVVFKDASDSIHKFGETSATSVGLATAEFNQMASQTGAFLKNVGFDLDSAAQETITLTTRAADMASVFNTDVSQALAAIQSGLKGEFNPLEQFGVKLNAAAIEAQALSMGLVESTVSMAEVEKAQSNMSNAEDKWISITRDARQNGKITEDQYKQLQQALWGIGEAYDAGLLGTEEWNSTIQGSLDIWRQYSSVLGEDGRETILAYEKSIGSLDQALIGQTGEITDAAKAQAALALIYKQTEQVAGDFANTSEGFANQMRQLKSDTTNLGASIGGMLMPYALQLTEWARVAIGWFKQLSPEQQKWILVILGAVAAAGPLLMIAGSLVTTIGALVPVITAVGGALLTLAPYLLIIAAVAALVYFAWTNNWGGIQEKTQAAITFIQGLIAGGMQFINDLTSGNLGVWSQLWNNTLAGIQMWWQLFTTNIQLIFQAFTAAFHGDWYTFGERLRMVWDNMWTGIHMALQIAWENIKLIFSTAITNIINTFRTTNWGQVGSDIVHGIANGLTQNLQWIIDAARSAAQAALQAAQGFLGIHSPSKVFEVQVGMPMAAGTALGWKKGLDTMLQPSFGLLEPASVPAMPGISAPAVSGGGSAGGGQNSDLMASLEDALQEFNRRIRTLPDDIARSNQSSIEKVLGRR